MQQLAERGSCFQQQGRAGVGAAMGAALGTEVAPLPTYRARHGSRWQTSTPLLVVCSEEWSTPDLAGDLPCGAQRQQQVFKAAVPRCAGVRAPLPSHRLSPPPAPRARCQSSVPKGIQLPAGPELCGMCLTHSAHKQSCLAPLVLLSPLFMVPHSHRQIPVQR